jgi:hypothetical protein
MIDPVTAMALAQGAYGVYRGIKAQQGLNALNKQRVPKYMDAAGPLQENIRMARTQMQQGMSPAAKAVANQAFASSQAGTYRQAQELSGGQMSSAIGRLGALQNFRYGSQMGLQDQMARERAQQTLMGQNLQLSALEQKDIAQGIADNRMLQQQYGAARQQAIADVFGAGMGAVQTKLAMSEADKNRQFYMDMLGNKNPTTTTDGSQNNYSSVFSPGTFPYSAPIGPKEGPPNLMNLPPSMGGTNLKAGFIPKSSGTPNPMNLPPSMGGTNLQAGFNRFSTPSFLSQYSPQQRMTVPDSESQRVGNPAGYSDMSGDPFYNQVYNPNALRFSNPYNMNRGFMDDYEAVLGPNGEIMYRPQ